MKTCRRCGESKEDAEFHKNKRMRDGLQSYCKFCMSEYIKKWVEENKDKRRLYLQEYLFLYGRHGKDRDRGGYLDGQGICLYCGELNPLLLEQHHPFGAKKSDFILSLCANHHKLITIYPKFMIWENPSPRLFSKKSDLDKAKKDAEYVNRLIARDINPYEAFLELNNLVKKRGVNMVEP